MEQLWEGLLEIALDTLHYQKKIYVKNLSNSLPRIERNISAAVSSECTRRVEEIVDCGSLNLCYSYQSLFWILFYFIGILMGSLRIFGVKGT